MNVESGSLVDDDNIKANLLGKTFSEVFINDVKYNLDDAIRTFDKNRYYIELDMDDIKISEFMVVSKLKNLNVHKSAGNDNVYPNVLRECCNSLVKFLHKKGDRHVQLNYRPISLTSVVCKVLESYP